MKLTVPFGTRSLWTELRELQRELAQVDLLANGRAGSRDWIEFLVLKLENLRIKMYQEQGHQTPHVHIDYGRSHHVASYSVSEPRRLAGTLDRRYDRAVIAWITRHRDQLLKVWSAARAGKDPGPLIAEIAGAGNDA